jgi:hypothetical protein
MDIACRLAFIGLVILVGSFVRPLWLVRGLARALFRISTNIVGQAKRKAAEVSPPRLLSFSKVRKA